MLLQAQKVGVAAKNAAKNSAKNAAKEPGKTPPARNAGNRAAATPTFTIQTLWRQALWGSAAAMALFVAILSTRSDVGAQRTAVILAALHPSSPSSLRAGQANGQMASQTPSSGAPRAFDLEAATRQLAQAVRGLTEDRDRLTARLAAVEHNLDDMTGSIRSQIEAAKNAAGASAQPWPGEQPPAVDTPSIIAAVGAPVIPAAAGVATPTPPAPLIEATAPAASTPLEYGIDLGGGPSISVLRVRWNAIAAAHADLLAAMAPVVAVRERSGHAELRLVAGPLTTPEAAARLCVALAPFRLACRPSLYDGQRLTVR